MSGADELDEAIALANYRGPRDDGDPPPPRRGPAQRPAARTAPHREPDPAPGTAPDPAPWTDPWAEEAEEADEEPAPAPAPRTESAGGDPDAAPDDDLGPVPGLIPSTARTRPAEQHREPRNSKPHSGRSDQLSWYEARALASRTGSVLDTVTLPLDRTLRHTLAEPLKALTDLPSFDTSAMDGWAVSGPGPWELADPAGEGPDAYGILAGDRAEPHPLADGHAVRIATGARIPPGTGAVLRSEYGELTGSRLRATGPPPQPGTDIRPRGQECRSGDRLLGPGTPVTPALLGLAAAAGYDELPVVRRPRAEVLVLGDELLHSGLPEGGRIRDALGPTVGPWLTGLGTDVLTTRRLGDDAEALHEAVAGTTADLVVTTGGTAHGPVDHVRPMLERTGARLLVDGVQVRPGHPMLLARLPGGAHLVGLPGNPLAALSGLVTLAEPLLRALSGRGPADDVRVPLAGEVQGHPRDARLVPVTYAPAESHARPLRYTGPAMLRGIATATALAVVPPGGAPAGTAVPLLSLPW